MKKSGLLIIGFLIAFNSSFANNLVLGAPTIGSGGATITFSIKWDNSWLVTTGPSNWDAVWIFVKRQACDQPNQNPWLHADIAATGHTIGGSQLQVDIVSDNKGVFIRRKTTGDGPGIGNVAQVDVTLTLATPLAAGENIGVYGMEMVNIPEGQFYIGDGSPSAGENQWNFTDGNSTNPLLITKAIQDAGIGTRDKYSKNNIGASVALPSTFPLGYYRFYCMKYEITSSMYVAFLNSLTYDQQLRLVRYPNQTPPESPTGTLVFSNINGYRIEIKTPGVSTTSKTPAVFANDATDNNIFDQEDDGLSFAVGFGSKQYLSFLDWAALRPMTEFEYEKACRGPLTPVVNEFSWGSTDLTTFNSFNINNRFKGNETLSGAGLGMVNYRTNTNYRVGIAATATSNRLQAGATYYGLLDMSGSQMERVVGQHNLDWSAFTTANGDGILTSDAYSNVTGWSEIIIGARGGSWRRHEALPISSRVFIGNGTYGGNDAELDWADMGGRGVRSY